MPTARLAAARAKTRLLEAQVDRFRGEDKGRDDDEDAKQRADVTSLLAAAHAAATSLEDDLEALRERLNPVLDDDAGQGLEADDEDGSDAKAIRELERVVRRIESAGAAIRYLTRNARI